jgi:hypothetical protein
VINGGTTIHTATGATVTVRRRGIEYDFETRNPRGEMISTVVMSEDDARALLDEIATETNAGTYDEGYDAGYDKGYSDGYDDAEAA